MATEQGNSAFIPFEDVQGQDDSFASLGAALYRQEREEYIRRMETEPYNPSNMFIVMRYDCPYACDHCFFSSNPTSRTVLPEDKLNEAIDFAANKDVTAVMLT